MPGQGPSGGHSLPPGGQCQAYRVTAPRPEAPFGGVYTAAAASGEWASRVGWIRAQTMRSRIPASPSPPPSRGGKERTGPRRTPPLQQAATQDRLSW
jgi:hypothetical protein